MPFDPDLVAKLAAPILSLLDAAELKHYTEARSRGVSFIGHVSAFTLQDEHHSIVIRIALLSATTADKCN